ncbi:NucA/NucB deoxyribonuclease domain-containing protein [Streptoalloteichus tenebrarius]|nr:NucA/NucB deoxyribonuclease domain-containing protein [Streptoalloteichus tenebrarius]BFF04169.1 hypothetical protein GCM10020241_58440 [Streptoalloteichus tenebrarius]
MLAGWSVGVNGARGTVTVSVRLVTLGAQRSARVPAHGAPRNEREGSRVATRTKGGVLLPVVIVVGLVAVFGANKVIDTVTGIFGGIADGSEIIGEGGDRVVVARAAASAAKQCTVQQMISARQCGDLTVLIVDASRMPFIARNTKLAWESGRPGILTMNRSRQAANRAAACPRSFPRPYGGSCDEYPMAATDEGGSGARTEEVPGRENSCQGARTAGSTPRTGIGSWW